MLNVTGRERRIIVIFEEIKDRDGKEFGNDANVVAVIKAVDEVDAITVMQVSQSNSMPRCFHSLLVVRVSLA